MAGLIGNLIYRVSVSAIVGAVVAGGVIYLSNERVVKVYKSDMAAQFEIQDMTNLALMQANEAMASAYGAIESQSTMRLAEFAESIDALEAKLAAMPLVEPADYTAVLDAITASNAELSAQIAELQNQLAASEE